MSWLKNIAIGFLISLTIYPHGQADDVVAFTNATVETVSKQGTLANATILVRDGKIEAVGKDVKLPTDARTVDLSGQTIMPALVDAYHPVSIAGLTRASAVRTVVFNGRVFQIGGQTSTTAPTYARLADVLDSRTLKNDLVNLSRQGVGFSNLVTRGYGQSVHARITPDQTQDAIVNADGKLFLTVTNSTSVLDLLRKGLKGSSRSSTSRTSSSTSSRTASTSSTAATSSSSSTNRSDSKSSTGSLTSLWSDVKEGKHPIILNINNAAAITYVLQIIKDYPKAKIVLIASGADVYRTLDQLKKTDISLLIKAGLDTVPRSSRRLNIAKLLHDADVEFGFSTSLDSSLTLMPDTPLFPVSLLVKTGLPKDAAIKALTLAPAKMLGLSKTLGSIEKGKQANLLVLDGAPTDPTTSVKQLFVEGKSIYENP